MITGCELQNFTTHQLILDTPLARNQAGILTPAERQELDEYERIEHLIVMLKLGNFPYLTPAATSS